ncbi:hypothetical protein ACFVMC_17320 [Nocardia sp. NPDC127579]|uniref:hypothetical protein n=1 Tax=Nocardia sp. NPDC127579 TaxID=3345402 RepID=UPI003634F285
MTAIGNWLNENSPGFNDVEKPENNRLLEGAKNTDYREEYFQETLFGYSNIGLNKDEETGVPGVLDGTIAGDAWEVFGNLSSASILTSATGTISVVVTAVDAFYDPFGFVGDQIAGWMLSHFEPFRKTLDAMAGNGDMVDGYATIWSNIGEELTKMAESWKTGLTNDISTWTGKAGDAYKATATELIDKIAAAGGVSASLGKAMTLCGELVTAFREAVETIVGSLLGALIGYTIELAVTLGAATPHVVSAVLARLARDAVKISMLLTKMAQAFTDTQMLTAALDAIIAAITNYVSGEEEQAQPA